MPTSRNDLVIKALGLMGISQIGQDPEAEDVELVDGYVDGMLANLARRKVFYVQDQTDIDDEGFLPLAKLLANRAGAEFGRPFDPGVQQRQEDELREMQPEPGANDVVTACYF